MVLVVFMSDLVSRLQSALDFAGLSWSKASQDIGLSPQAPSKWKKGQISRESLEKLAVLTKVNLAWLATGQGEMTPQIPRPPLNPTALDGYATIGDWSDETPLESDEVELTFYKELGFACGHGREGEARANEWRKLRFSRMTLERLGIYKDKAFAATAQDDSMMPTICDGDTVFVDEGRTKIKDGRIFAIEHGGLFYCKRLYNLPNGGMRIVSDNVDEFPEKTLSRDDVEREGFRIIGWVFSISRLERW